MERLQIFCSQRSIAKAGRYKSKFARAPSIANHAPLLKRDGSPPIQQKYGGVALRHLSTGKRKKSIADRRRVKHFDVGKLDSLHPGFNVILRRIRPSLS